MEKMERHHESAHLDPTKQERKEKATKEQHDSSVVDGIIVTVEFVVGETAPTIQERFCEYLLRKKREQ